jgi:CheY-like chemotaxis protein
MHSSSAVLVVDDDADVREAIRDTLAQEGYAIAEARDGRAALAYLRDNPLPPLILLDWNMAPMNGREVMEELARDPVLARVPVVLLTADARVEGRASSLGFVGHLKKPVELDALLELMEKYAR